MTDDDRRPADRLRTSESRAAVGDDVRPAVRPRRLPIAAVAGAMVVLVVAVVAGSGVLSSQPTTGEASPTPIPSPTAAPTEEPSPSSTSTPVQTPETTPDPTPEPTPEPAPLPSGPAMLAWERGEPQDGRVNALIHRGGTWVAGGSIRVDGATRAAVWMSDDGRSWDAPLILGPEPVADADGMLPRYWINGFGQWNGQLLAYGWNGIGCCDGGRAMLWRSSDAATWSVVETDFGSPYHFPQQSIETDDGGLAILSITGLGSGASMFHTADLVTWSEHPITDQTRPEQIAGFARSPELWLAAGTHTPGWTVEDGPRPQAQLWASSDGRDWESITPPTVDGSLGDIGWDPLRERFVVVGTNDQGHPTAWLSSDARSWVTIPLASERGELRDLAITDGLIVASGVLGPLLETTGQTIAWSSHDGVTWRVLPLGSERAQAMTAVGDSAAVLVMTRYDDGRGDWWEPWRGRVGE